MTYKVIGDFDESLEDLMTRIYQFVIKEWKRIIDVNVWKDGKGTWRSTIHYD